MYNNVPGIYASGSPDHNLYAQGGENAFVCGNNYYAFTQFRRWRACIRLTARPVKAALWHWQLCQDIASPAVVTNAGLVLAFPAPARP